MLVEKAAKAHWDAKRYSTSREWEDLPQSERTKAMRHMAVALEVAFDWLAEPGESAIMAGGDMACTEGDIEEVYRAMLAAMRKEALG